MPDFVESILAPDGLVAKHLPGYEHRPQQLEMAAAVDAAFRGNRHLVVEAGTGVGKSFAYLVPAIREAVREQRRVVVSTYTINLQEQLIEKDLPFLKKATGEDFVAVLVKGRSNYGGLRRLARACNRAANLFEGRALRRELERIAEWAMTTEDGSLSDLSPAPDWRVWGRVCAEHGNCRGRRCEHQRRCFYQRARRKVHRAQVLVVNHALFFSNLAIRTGGGAGILPKFDRLVFDEAHNIETVACDQLGIAVTSGQVGFLLGSVWQPKRRKGLLATLPAGTDKARRTCESAAAAAEAFFDALRAWFESDAGASGRITEPNVVANPLSPALRNLAGQLRDLARTATDGEDQDELASAAERAREVADAVDAFITQSYGDADGPNAVYWIEVSGGGRARIYLRASPIHVGPMLDVLLWQKVPSAVLTSATLAVAPTAEFAYIRERLGLAEADTLRVGSPFNYELQVRL